MAFGAPGLTRAEATLTPSLSGSQCRPPRARAERVSPFPFAERMITARGRRQSTEQLVRTGVRQFERHAGGKEGAKDFSPDAACRSEPRAKRALGEGLVDQNIAGWNQLTRWLLQVDSLKPAL